MNHYFLFYFIFFYWQIKRARWTACAMYQWPDPHTAQHSTAQDKTRKETGEPTNLPNYGTRTLEIYSTETRDCDGPVPERGATISRGVQKINEGLQALRKTAAAAAAAAAAVRGRGGAGCGDM